MFILLDNNAQLPTLYPKVERKLPTVGDKGWTKVGGFTLRDKVDFIPQPGLQENVCACEANVIYMCGAATMGKMQPYDAQVLTPFGFKDMGSLVIGETISGINGTTQQIQEIYEHGLKDVYRVTFDDGATTECGLDHLWSVAFRSSKHKYTDFQTQPLSVIIERIKNGERAAIPFCGQPTFHSADLPIKPYTLGSLLGNGCLCGTNIEISTIDDCVIERISAEGYKCTRVKSPKNYDYRLRRVGLWNELKELGLLGTRSWSKFIPQNYLYADVNSRLELLQGLIDADGHIDKMGHIQYYTVSQQLAKDVQWLVRSIGGRCSIISKHTSYTHKGEKKNGKDCFVLNINTPINHRIVGLGRKRKRLLDCYSNGRTQFRHVIKSIEYVGKKQCRCLLVSNPDHLYITDDFIVTHNSFSGIMLQLYRVDKKGSSGAMVSARLQDSKKGGSIFRDNEMVLGGFGNCEYNSSDYPTFVWPHWGSAYRLIHSNFNTDNPAEWLQFVEYAKKNQNGYQYFDEANDLPEKQYHYWNSRNRDDSGLSPQSVYSFNPPEDRNHYFTRNLVNGGYIGSDYYFRPEMNGKIRYYYLPTDNIDDAIWGDTPEEVAVAANITLTAKDRAVGLTEVDMIRSFAAFTGEASENRMLVASTGGKSVANLLYSGQGESLKGGYFGGREKTELNINKQMIHLLWENPISDDQNMYASMDIASGKDDSAPMIIWKGTQMIEIEYFKGDPNTLTPWIQSMLTRYNVPITNFVYDSTGHGYWVQALTNGIGIASNRRPVQEYDEYGNPTTTHNEFFNLRSQLLGKLEVMLKRGEISCLISKDKLVPFGKGQTRRLFDVLCDGVDLFRTARKNGKTYYHTKEEFKSRYKYSPGELDSMALFCYLMFDTRTRKQPKAQVTEDAYVGLYRGHGSSWGSGLNW